MAAKSYKPGWYGVKTTTGAIVLVWHGQQGPIHLGQGLVASKTMSLNYTQRAPAGLPPATPNLLKKLGATADQIAAYVFQSDVGALNDWSGAPTVSEMVIPPHPKKSVTGRGVKAWSGRQPVSTAGRGDAQATGPNINVPNPLSAIDSVIKFVTSASNWKRIGQVLLGGVLILMGLRTLSGHTVTPASVVTAPAKAAKKVVVSKVA